MISNQCFTKEWVEARKTDLRLPGDDLVEKTIHAFALLGHLVRREVPLVFKGGTSMLLRIPEFRRLSIDIDVLCQLPWDELEKILDEVGREAPFVDWEEDERGKDRLPERRHYKFFFEPCRPRGKGASYVLLDVVKEEPLHPVIEDVPICSSLFEVEDELFVRMPTVEGLLGDKLTAFAPNSIGVPATDFYKMQVVKQLFDVGELFNVSADFAQVATAYDAMFEAENKYRDSRFTREQALGDTLEVARLLTIAGVKGSAANEQVELLLKGRDALKGHLVGGRFTDIDFKIAAGKAGCLAKILLGNDLNRLSGKFRYDVSNVAVLKQLRLEEDSILEMVKRQSPEAFHYWALAHGKLGK